MRRLAAAALLALAACGGATPAERVRAYPAGARVARDLEPADVIPADLDLVLRIDLGRLRAGLGPATAEALTKRALSGTGDTELAEALGCAEAAWLGVRAGEAETGDRVVVLEGRRCMPELSRGRWEKVPSGNAKLLIFDRQGPAPRGGTARIMNLGDHATAFVSPVELDSVKRVLEHGPDPQRGDPRSEGLVSFDLRPRPLPPSLAAKYPSIAKVLGGVERVKGTAVLGDEGLKVSAEVVGKTVEGAAKAAAFLEAMRASLAEGKFGEAVKGGKVEVVEKTVAVKVVVPAKALVAMLAERP